MQPQKQNILQSGVPHFFKMKSLRLKQVLSTYLSAGKWFIFFSVWKFSQGEYFHANIKEVDNPAKFKDDGLGAIIVEINIYILKPRCKAKVVLHFPEYSREIVCLYQLLQRRCIFFFYFSIGKDCYFFGGTLDNSVSCTQDYVVTENEAVCFFKENHIQDGERMSSIKGSQICGDFRW